MNKEEVEMIVEGIEDLPYSIPSYVVDFVKQEIFRAILKDRTQITNFIKEIK
jgi:hypothetical protein